MIPTITIKDAALSYSDALVFSHLNLTITGKKWLALLGPSGVGKTSLLRMLAGLHTSDEKIFGQILTENNIPLHQQVAYMAQTDLLLPWLNVLDNALLTLKLRSHTKKDCEDITNTAMLLLQKVGLQRAMHLYPKQLSGGMRQRVALVRTLVENKPIILMDEPFSALDAITRYKLQELAAELLREKTVIFITHDPTEALRLADEIYMMQGQPASLTSVASLSSNTPRDLTDPSIASLQAKLFQELSKSAGDFQ